MLGRCEALKKNVMDEYNEFETLARHAVLTATNLKVKQAVKKLEGH
jgi:hypothetical protein